MFERELIVSGLKRQHDLLKDLIDHLEKTPQLNAFEHHFYNERTKRVVSNLQKLRKIKRTYSINHNSSETGEII